MASHGGRDGSLRRGLTLAVVAILILVGGVVLPFAGGMLYAAIPGNAPHALSTAAP